MKNVVIFLLFLCVQMVSLDHYAHASYPNEKVCFSLTCNLKKTLPVKSVDANYDYLIINNISLKGESPNLISIDDEDENEDIIKKHVSQVRYFLPFCYAFISNSRFSFLAERLPSGRHLSYTSSCKYILQKTLRI